MAGLRGAAGGSGGGGGEFDGLVQGLRVADEGREGSGVGEGVRDDVEEGFPVGRVVVEVVVLEEGGGVGAVG